MPIESMRNNVIGSIYWTVGAKAGSQFVTFISTIILTHLLSPVEFGLAAIAVVYIGFVSNFLDIGILQALIQRKTLDQIDLSSCFWFLLFFGCLVFLGTYLCSSFIADLFRAKEARSILLVQSLVFLVLPIRTIPSAILSRELRIDSIAKTETILVVVRFILSIGMAFMGYGVWSLVIPFVVTEIATGILLAVNTMWIPSATFAWSSIKPIITFGASLVGSRLLWFFYNRADYFIIARLLGPEILGVYSIAQQFAFALLQFVSITVNRVIYPVFARLQEHNDKLKEIYLGTIKYMAYLVFPALLGLTLLAQDITYVFLGKKWTSVAFPIQVLAFVSLFKIVESIAGSLLNARGMARTNLWFNALCFAFLFAGFYAGGYYLGFRGILLTWIIVFPPLFFLIVHLSNISLGLTMLIYLWNFWHPLKETVFMGILVFFLQLMLTHINPAIRLPILMLAGILSYFFLVYVGQRKDLLALKRLLYPEKKTVDYNH